MTRIFRLSGIAVVGTLCVLASCANLGNDISLGGSFNFIDHAKTSNDHPNDKHGTAATQDTTSTIEHTVTVTVGGSTLTTTRTPTITTTVTLPNSHSKANSGSKAQSAKPTANIKNSLPIPTVTQSVTTHCSSHETVKTSSQTPVQTSDVTIITVPGASGNVTFTFTTGTHEEPTQSSSQMSITSGVGFNHTTKTLVLPTGGFTLTKNKTKISITKSTSATTSKNKPTDLVTKTSTEMSTENPSGTEPKDTRTGIPIMGVTATPGKSHGLSQKRTHILSTLLVAAAVIGFVENL
ncbi:hypothetical protein EDC01DRAFT_636295 [Geopyxis carbonaria]|nr:hypothetical protein EDC01DRAFT_636295 [Geopyxis carbonaria]